MQKRNKIILIILGVLFVGGFAFVYGNAELFQGRMFSYDKLSAYDKNNCYDSDGGINYEEIGTVYGNFKLTNDQFGNKIQITQFGNKTDICTSRSKVKEYYCRGKYISSKEYNCENGCSDGACKTKPEDYCKQDHFKVGSILLVEDKDNIDPAILERANYYRTQTSVVFSEATHNLASMDTSEPLFIVEVDDAMFDVNGYLSEKHLITNEFYTSNSDDYDFLILFSTIISVGEPSNFRPISNHIKGIGMEEYNDANDFGSAGKLQGLMALYEWDNDPMNVLNITDNRLNTILHEFGHRWGIYDVGSDFDLGGEGPKIKSLGPHFYGGLESPDSTGSPLYANYFEPNGDGTFANASEFGIKKYHPFVLYFMGLLSESEYDKEYNLYDQGPGGINSNKAVVYGTVSVNDIIDYAGARECE